MPWKVKNGPKIEDLAVLFLLFCLDGSEKQEKAPSDVQNGEKAREKAQNRNVSRENTDFRGMGRKRTSQVRKPP